MFLKDLFMYNMQVNNKINGIKFMITFSLIILFLIVLFIITRKGSSSSSKFGEMNSEQQEIQGIKPIVPTKDNNDLACRYPRGHLPGSYLLG